MDQYFLGIKYYSVDNFENNNNKAIYWSQKSALQNYAPAQNFLGELYKDNKNDFEKAFYWFLKAAKNGNSDAQNNVGNMYSIGLE